MSDFLDLLDYRRRVADIYRQVREGTEGPETWRAWVAARDDLFGTHPQSPVEDQRDFGGLSYFDYDPMWRCTGLLTELAAATEILNNSGEGATRFVKAGKVDFSIRGHDLSLDVLWLDAYGGGLFIPFTDQTSGKETYGGGRYLIDTVKGADLGHTDDRLVLDFNYAYHPSCVHSPRWSCPLAPQENRLALDIRAGERFDKVRA